jgi:hypothetical protein
MPGVSTPPFIRSPLPSPSPPELTPSILQAKKRGFITTGAEIIKRETPLGLYKGLGAVVTGIVPKMAIRFTSFGWYKAALADKTTGQVTGQATFLAGLLAGVTEAVAVVTPMEVVKIRLQAQHHSMADPLDVPKYRNAAHATYTVVVEEGFSALYRGVALTALRQGSNQAGEMHPFFNGPLSRLGRLSVANAWVMVDSQFHRIHRVQSPPSIMAARLRRSRTPQLADDGHRSYLRRHGTPE